MSDSLKSTQKFLVFLLALSTVAAMRSDKAISIHTGRVPVPYFQSLKPRDFAKYVIFQLVLFKLLYFQRVKPTLRSQTIFKIEYQASFSAFVNMHVSKSQHNCNHSYWWRIWPTSIQYFIRQNVPFNSSSSYFTIKKYIMNNNRAERPS